MAAPAYVPISDERSLARHTESMAVVNTDTAARDRYRARRDKILADQAALIDANAEIAELKKQFGELRALVDKYIITETT